MGQGSGCRPIIDLLTERRGGHGEIAEQRLAEHRVANNSYAAGWAIAPMKELRRALNSNTPRASREAGCPSRFGVEAYGIEEVDQGWSFLRLNLSSRFRVHPSN